jgi:hypothetical protein
MSVLVEAICVVIPRQILDRKYPGGTDAFMLRSARLSAEHRYVCMDPHLVCLSYFSPDAADRGIAPLVSAGMTEIANDEFTDVAIVDQRHGPILPCTWLMWTHHPAGFTSAWLASELPGGLSAPDGWSAEQSRRLSRVDIRTFPDRALKLADEDGVQTWLDFNTGRITVTR